MRVDRVELYLLDRPLPRPLVGRVTSGGRMHTLVAVVRTSDGLSGQGYGWAINETHASFIRGATETAAHFLLGRDPRRMERIWSEYGLLSNFVGSTGLATIGMSILDMALWDITCRAYGLPLWRVLGGHKDVAPMYLNIIDADPDGRASTEDLEAALDSGKDRGFTAFKTRLGVNAPTVDAERVRMLVERQGSGGHLAVDIAQRWSAADSRAACSAMDELGLRWIEDPAPYDDVAGLSDLVRRLNTPICTGENAYGLSGPQRVVTEIRSDLLMLDLQRCGGISGWRKAAALAEAHHVSVTTHTYPHIGIHLVCGTSNAPVGEYLPWWDELMGGPPIVVDGVATPDDEPGIGIRVDDELLRSATWSRSLADNTSKG